MRLVAGEGLTIDIDEAGALRVGVDGGDWLGPGRVGPTLTPVMSEEALSVTDEWGSGREVVVVDGDVRCSVRAYEDRPLAVLRIEAVTALSGIATGSFDQPSVAWPTFDPSGRNPDEAPEGLRGLVFQHCEFGLPSNAGPALDGWFLLPHRPPTGWPLVVHADGRALLVAPLDAFHEQVIGLNDGTLRMGWHGDLEEVPAGFTTHMALVAGHDARECIERWGRLVLEAAGTVRPGRWADALASRPSYWTDNGAAYWYRTEPGHDAAGSIVAAVEDLRKEGVPLGAVQVDSWFYPHTELRPFDTDEWLVPPAPMLAWEERADVLPDGLADLRARLGGPPLVAHIRHLSSQAPIAAEVPVWVDGDRAVPATSEGYERWLDQCVAWGVETFEHDWLVEVFFHTRPLRAVPGRARAWQEGIDRAARDRGVTLQWCMGTPADFAQTSTLTQVTSVRTCGDHGYIATPGQLWAWFCTTNALARALGLMPFKDVFRADPEVAGDNGEPEALLSALSTGPVGLGDRVGRFEPSLAMATCRADGLLVKPDVPVAATAATLMAAPAFNAVPMVAECHTDHPAGRWSYVVAMHTAPSDEAIEAVVSLPDLGASAPAGDVVAWDWRAGTARLVGVDGELPLRLEREGWTYVVLAPVLSGGVAVVGDTSKFVPAGDARVEVSEVDGGVRVVVKGAGETVEVTGWAASEPVVEGAPSTWDPTTGVWVASVAVPSRGWATFEVRPS